VPVVPHSWQHCWHCWHCWRRHRCVAVNDAAESREALAMPPPPAAAAAAVAGGVCQKRFLFSLAPKVKPSSFISTLSFSLVALLAVGFVAGWHCLLSNPELRRFYGDFF